MTTVAYKDGVMASDSLVTANNTRIGTVRKIGLVNGWLYGYAGGLSECQKIERWIREGADPETRPRKALKNSKAIMVHESAPKSVLIFDDGASSRLDTEAIAIGSGEDFALAAMTCGLSAPEAIGIAKKLDAGTGGRIISRRFAK